MQAQMKKRSRQAVHEWLRVIILPYNHINIHVELFAKVLNSERK